MNTKIHYRIIPSQSRIPTVQAQKDGEAFYLHSTVQPMGEATDWVKRLELTANTCYVILGAGLGYHIQALLENLPENSKVWVLHTRSEAELLDYTGNKSSQSWMLDKRLSFLYLINIHNMAIYIANSMIENKIKRICLCRHFPTMRLATSEYQYIESELTLAVRKIMALNFNINVSTEYKFLLNYWRNFSEFIFNPALHYWNNMFADLPIIIVGAGPSLNKNISEVKQCVDKAIIIAAGTAVGALYKHGIIPHFIIVTDANPEMSESIKAFISVDTVLLATTSVDSEVVANYIGPKCFFETWSGYTGEFTKYLPKTIAINQTSSVSTAAVDFARKCGAATIILVGQDLAFGESNQEHATGVQAPSYKGWATIKVPGYYGGEVDSVEAFKIVVDHFNQYVPNWSHVDFINATEGGALIKSMRNVPLETVRRNMLVKKIDKDALFALFRQGDCDLLQFEKIAGYLHKMSKLLRKLNIEVQEFCDMEQAIIVSEKTERAVTPQDVERFENFYKRIKRRNVYSYISKAVDSWLTLLKFQIDDGMPLDQQYEFYWNITGDVKRMLGDLTESLTKNMSVIDRHKRGLK